MTETKELTIDAIFEPIRQFTVGVNDPSELYLKTVETHDDMYKLSRGTYLLRFSEGVKVGKVGEVYPVQDLFYSGVMLQGSIYTSGDAVECVIFCPQTVRFPKDAVLAVLQTEDINPLKGLEKEVEQLRDEMGEESEDE